MRSIALFTLALGCSGGGGDELQPTSTATNATVSDVWDVPAPNEACEDVDGSPLAGATSWWIGEYDLDLDGGEGSGTEHWILYANDEWELNGGWDCSIVWSVYMSVIETGACSTCDFGLFAEATPNASESDCPANLFDNEGVPFESTYDVRLEDDGTAMFYYADTGNLVGEGYGTTSEAAWVYEGGCVWF